MNLDGAIIAGYTAGGSRSLKLHLANDVKPAAIASTRVS